MRTGESAMPSLADDAIVSGDDAPNHGVGFDASPAFLCYMYSTFHQAPALDAAILHALWAVWRVPGFVGSAHCPNLV